MNRYQRKQWESACRRWDAFCARHDFPPRRAWSDDDESFLRANYDRHGPVWCGVRMDRTPEAVRWHVMQMRAKDELSAFARQYLGMLSPRA